MISETTFSGSYTSIWKSIAPTLDVFVRRANLNLYERVFPPLKSEVSPSRRAFVNELSFSVFCEVHADKINGEPIKSLAGYVVETSNSVMERLFVADGANVNLPISRAETKDIDHQVRRLIDFFSNFKIVKTCPFFNGCGIIDNCRGDVLADDILYEIKAGERNFRSIDFHQIITYCALNYAANGHTIEQVGLFNPRVGISFIISLEEISLEISGKQAPDLMADVVLAISSGEISR